MRSSRRRRPGRRWSSRRRRDLRRGRLAAGAGRRSIPGGDEPHYLVVTQSLLADHDLRSTNNHARGDYRAYFPAPLKPDYRAAGRDGAIYSIHPVGVSVLIAPAFALWRLSRRQPASSCCSPRWRPRCLAVVARETASASAAAIVRMARHRDERAVRAAQLCDLPGVRGGARRDGSRCGLPVTASRPRPTRVVRGLALGALPWLGTKYAPMALVAIALVCWRCARDDARARRDAVRGARWRSGSASSGGSTGTPSPTAPYGAVAPDGAATPGRGTARASSLDQEYGLARERAGRWRSRVVGWWRLWRRDAAGRWAGADDAACRCGAGAHDRRLRAVVGRHGAAGTRAGRRAAARSPCRWLGCGIDCARTRACSAPVSNGSSCVGIATTVHARVRARRPAHRQRPRRRLRSCSAISSRRERSSATRRRSSSFARPHRVGAVARRCVWVAVAADRVARSWRSRRGDPRRAAARGVGRGRCRLLIVDRRRRSWPRRRTRRRRCPVESRVAADVLDAYDERARARWRSSTRRFGSCRRLSRCRPTWCSWRRRASATAPQPIRVMLNTRLALPAGHAIASSLTPVPGATLSGDLGRAGRPARAGRMLMWPLSAPPGAAWSQTFTLDLDASFVGFVRRTRSSSRASRASTSRRSTVVDAAAAVHRRPAGGRGGHAGRPAVFSRRSRLRRGRRLLDERRQHDVTLTLARAIPRPAAAACALRASSSGQGPTPVPLATPAWSTRVVVRRRGRRVTVPVPAPKPAPAAAGDHAPTPASSLPSTAAPPATGGRSAAGSRRRCHERRCQRMLKFADVLLAEFDRETGAHPPRAGAGAGRSARVAAARRDR